VGNAVFDLEVSGIHSLNGLSVRVVSAITSSHAPGPRSAMQIHRNRALSQALVGNASFAIEDLNKLVQLQTPRGFVEPEVFFLRGMCWALQHQHIMAVKDFDRAFEANARLKKHPWVESSSEGGLSASASASSSAGIGKTHAFSGSLEVRIEQQRAAVRRTMRELAGEPSGPPVVRQSSSSSAGVHLRYSGVQRQSDNIEPPITYLLQPSHQPCFYVLNA
jgi:hypothetical protein